MFYASFTITYDLSQSVSYCPGYWGFYELALGGFKILEQLHIHFFFHPQFNYLIFRSIDLEAAILICRDVWQYFCAQFHLLS